MTPNYNQYKPKPINNKHLKSLHLLEWLTPLTLACSVVMGGGSSAQALQFNFTYAPGTTLEQMLGYEMAGKYWSNYLADDVTLNIFIEPTNNLPTNVIGGSIPGVTSQKFSDVYDSLQVDALSATDQTALANIYTKGAGYDALTASYGKGNRNSNSSNGINKINLTRANAKALGMINGNDTSLDAYILVSNLGNITSRPVSWNYFSDTNNSSTIATDTLDFFSVAVHELTHNLGFISGTDSPEYASLLTKKKSLSGADMSKFGYLMDMFRLSENSLNNNGKPDISVGEKTFLSFNGGTSKLADMSSGSTQFGGNGNQGSHWNKDATYDGIMEASLSAGGTRKLVTNNDLTVLDVIGWNLQQNNQDLTTIFNIAKSGLASKMGVTTSWMDANPTQAALRLTPNFIDLNNNNRDDRDEQLDQMITSSDVYQWGFGGYRWGFGGYRQGWNGLQSNATVAEGFWQNAAWETLDEVDGDHDHDHDHDHLTSYSQSQSVPEPTTIGGLLGMAVLGIAARLKRRCQN